MNVSCSGQRALHTAVATVTLDPADHSRNEKQLVALGTQRGKVHESSPWKLKWPFPQGPVSGLVQEQVGRGRATPGLVDTVGLYFTSEEMPKQGGTTRRKFNLLGWKSS